MLIDIGKGLQNRERLPRVFVNRPIEYLSPVLGVNLLLQDRTSYFVLDMNLSGLVVALPSYLNQFRPGHFLECKLKISSVLEAIPLKLQSHSRNSAMACLILGSISSDNRLKMDQITKNQLIFSNLRKMPVKILKPEFQNYEWWTGLFDTNFLYSEDQDEGIKKAIIEYDGIVLFVTVKGEESQFWVHKSTPTVNPLVGYEEPWEKPWAQNKTHKIIMSDGWLERALYYIQSVSPEAGLGRLAHALRNI